MTDTAEVFEDAPIVEEHKPPKKKGKVPKWVKITAIVLIAVLAVAGIAIGIVYAILVKPDIEKSDGSEYFQFGFQDAPSPEYLAAVPLPYSKEVLKGVYDKIKVDNTYDAEKFVDYLGMAQGNTFGDGRAINGGTGKGGAYLKATFVGTDTAVNMVEVGNDSVFEMVQHSTYAEIYGPDGAYYQQTVSGLDTLVTKFPGPVQNIVKSLARYATRTLRNYGGHNYYTPSDGGDVLSAYNEILGFNAGETRLAGANVEWNTDKSTKTEISTEPPKEEPQFTLDPKDDPQLEYKDGKYQINTTTYGADKEAYFYLSSDEFTWAKKQTEFNAANGLKDDKGDPRKGGHLAWDEYRQCYSGFTRDYKWNNWSNTGNQAQKIGRVHIQAYLQLEHNIMLSNHVIRPEYVDLSTIEIKEMHTADDPDNMFYAIKFSIKPECVDAAAIYAKAALISDTNNFVMPTEVVYSGLQFEVDVWADSGLLKKWDRVETWSGKGDMSSYGIGKIQNVDKTNTNTSKQPFSYAEEDYSMDRYVAEDVWPGFKDMKVTG